jgi:hypothetical protein
MLAQRRLIVPNNMLMRMYARILLVREVRSTVDFTGRNKGGAGVGSKEDYRTQADCGP